MPNAHPTAIDEIDDLRRLAESQHVRRQHPVMRGQRSDVALPAQFGAGTELAAVQQHHRVTLAGLEIAGDKAVDHGGSVMNLHRRPLYLIAIGFTGDPTAPMNLSGGATSWNS